ncbi:MAG: hypothetical protein Fur0032_18030 [Terrimicrobiaceae bacterium]
MTPTLQEVLARPRPCLALAPMQDVTTWEFWRLTASYGGADLYFTEFFRVTQNTHPTRKILRSVVENPTGQPVIAQMIGNDVGELVRFAKRLQRCPVAAIDLNLGCPAPVVYRKCAGGGLLREPRRVDAILGALREAITDVPFTVKTRIGFSDPGEFDGLLKIFQKHPVDLWSVHGRTVTEGYRDIVHDDRIADAVRELRGPVLANGSVNSPGRAVAILQKTGARGVMLGRSAVRAPWLFQQIRSALAGDSFQHPTGRDIQEYICRLYDSVTDHGISDTARTQHLKKYLTFVAQGVGADFLHGIRRCQTFADIRSICQEFLDHDQPMDLVPASAGL